MGKKILILSHKFYPDVGGIEVNSEILATEFQKVGHEVKIATWTKLTGNKVFEFQIERAPSFLKLIALHKWADVILENNPALRLSWPSVFFKKRHVVALCTWIQRSTGEIQWQDKLKLRWLKKASAVIAVSEVVRKKCWKSAKVIGNPYRSHVFKAFTDYETRNINFVFLGRLVSDKGADIAIKAMQQIIYNSNLALKLPKPLLTIIGEGTQKEYLQNLCTELHLEEYVHFTGTLSGEELVNSLNKHKYMIVPSVWEEPFGNVALEGMACACLPFVSNSGGLPDAVGKAGVIFEKEDVASLLDSIVNILNNPDSEREFRNHSKQHLAMHQPKEIARQYLEFIFCTNKEQE